MYEFHKHLEVSTVRCITHSLLRIASSFRARCFASELAGHPGLWNWQSSHLICPSCTVPIRGETEISQASTRRYAQHFSSNFFRPYFVSRFISSLLILESWTPRFGPNPWDVEGWLGGEAEDLQASWGWKEPVSNVFECYKLYVITSSCDCLCSDKLTEGSARADDSWTSLPSVAPAGSKRPLLTAWTWLWCSWTHILSSLAAIESPEKYLVKP